MSWKDSDEIGNRIPFFLQLFSVFRFGETTFSPELSIMKDSSLNVISINQTSFKYELFIQRFTALKPSLTHFQWDVRRFVQFFKFFSFDKNVFTLFFFWLLWPFQRLSCPSSSQLRDLIPSSMGYLNTLRVLSNSSSGTVISSTVYPNEFFALRNRNHFLNSRRFERFFCLNFSQRWFFCWFSVWFNYNLKTRERKEYVTWWNVLKRFLRYNHISVIIIESYHGFSKGGVNWEHCSLANFGNFCLSQLKLPLLCNWNCLSFAIEIFFFRCNWNLFSVAIETFFPLQLKPFFPLQLKLLCLCNWSFLNCFS